VLVGLFTMKCSLPPIPPQEEVVPIQKEKRKKEKNWLLLPETVMIVGLAFTPISCPVVLRSGQGTGTWQKTDWVRGNLVP